MNLSFDDLDPHVQEQVIDRYRDEMVVDKWYSSLTEEFFDTLSQQGFIVTDYAVVDDKIILVVGWNVRGWLLNKKMGNVYRKVVNAFDDNVFDIKFSFEAGLINHRYYFYESIDDDLFTALNVLVRDGKKDFSTLIKNFSVLLRKEYATLVSDDNIKEYFVINKFLFSKTGRVL